MSLREPRCAKHPSLLLVGVCAFCLRERLAGLDQDVECASDATHRYSSKEEKHYPGRRLAGHGSRKQPSGKKGCDQPPCNVSVEPVVKEGLQDDTIPHTSFLAYSHGATDKGSLKSVVVETVTANKLNKFPISRTFPTGPTGVACEPMQAKFPGSIETRGSDTIRGISPPIRSNTARYENASSMDTSPCRRSFSLAKKLSFTPVDIKMPTLEDDQHKVAETKSNMHLQKHPSAACTTPLVCIGEQAKLVPSMCQVCNAASPDNKRNGFNAVFIATNCLPFPESTIENGRDLEIVPSSESPNPKHEKKTLSSLFSLDDFEFLVLKAKTEESKTSVDVKGDAMFNGSTSATVQNILQSKTIQRSCRHGSFSERAESCTYPFPVRETTDSKPLAWLSALFQRRKRESLSKPVGSLTSYSEHNSGWEAARQSWEAPRPSSWEQFRFSSFEGLRSSWERARPSWEALQISDGDSVFSGFDFLIESLSDMREDAILAHKNQQELAVGDCRNGFPEVKRLVDSKDSGLKSKSSVLKTPRWDDKDRPHTFLSAKATLMQRDVSTQTTPPRASDAAEIFIQQKLQQSGHHCGQRYTKAAVWSKVWNKTFSNSKWGFKHKFHKEMQPKEMADAMMSIDELHDQGNMIPERSFVHRGINIASKQHPKFTCVDNIEDYEACDAFFSPLEQSKDVMTTLASRGDACIQKDENLDKYRGSNLALENGLLKFYLTPIRGLVKSKQGIYGLS